MRIVPYIFVCLIILLIGRHDAQAGDLTCLFTPKNTAYYLKNCCPQPCPVFDRGLYQENLKKKQALQGWAEKAGINAVHFELILKGIGTKTETSQIIASPLLEYNILEQASIRSCLSTPQELIDNNLLLPYTNPPETEQQFQRRAFDTFILRTPLENAPLHLSSVPERVGRKFCRESLKYNYAVEQLSVALAVQSTLRAFQEKLYSYIRMTASSSIEGCTAGDTSLIQYFSAIENILGTVFGGSGAIQVPELPGCVRQDMHLNTQLRADQVLLKTYLDHLRSLYNMGDFFSGLPGNTEFGAME